MFRLRVIDYGWCGFWVAATRAHVLYDEMVTWNKRHANDKHFSHFSGSKFQHILIQHFWCSHTACIRKGSERWMDLLMLIGMLWSLVREGDIMEVAFQIWFCTGNHDICSTKGRILKRGMTCVGQPCTGISRYCHRGYENYGQRKLLKQLYRAFQ